MKVRNTHCIEMVLTPRDIAKALGHEEAGLRSAELTLKDGDVTALRVVLEYVIATKGIQRIVRTGSPDPCAAMQ